MKKAITKTKQYALCAFRLKEDERKALLRLARKLDLSQRQVVSRALRELDESVKKNG